MFPYHVMPELEIRQNLGYFSPLILALSSSWYIIQLQKVTKIHISYNVQTKLEGVSPKVF